MSRRTVHKHTQALLRDGYVVLLNPGGSPKQYGPGPMQLPPKQGPSGMVDPSRNLPVKLHHVKIYFRVVTEPTVDLDDLQWDNVWTASKTGSGDGPDRHYQLDKGLDEFSDELSPVKSVIYHRGPNKSSLQVNLEHVNVPIDQYSSVYSRRFAKAQDIANMLARRLGCRFGLPREPENPHAALPPPPGITEEKLRRAKELNFQTDYASVEGSDGPPEFEIKDLDLLSAYGNLPKILDSLLEADESNRTALVREAQRANITVQSLAKMTRILQGHQEQLELLMRLVTTTATEEEKREPADPGMMIH